MKETYEVTIDRPKGVTARKMAAYIREAVLHWGAATDPFASTSKLAQVQVQRSQVGRLLAAYRAAHPDTAHQWPDYMACQKQKTPGGKSDRGFPDRRAGRKDAAARKGGTKKGGAQ